MAPRVSSDLTLFNESFIYYTEESEKGKRNI